MYKTISIIILCLLMVCGFFIYACYSTEEMEVRLQLNISKHVTEICMPSGVVYYLYESPYSFRAQGIAPILLPDGKPKLCTPE